MIKELISYYNDNPHGYWFKRKLYGWGWVPVTWQGWTTLIVYLLIVLLLTRTPLIQNNPFAFFASIIILTMALLAICYKKGEKPAWQWGVPKK